MIKVTPHVGIVLLSLEGTSQMFIITCEVGGEGLDFPHFSGVKTEAW